MADIRINALATTAASTASDDFVAVDGSANGTRKLNAFSPTFGGNLTVSGTGTNLFGGGSRDAFVIESDTAGNGAFASAKNAAANDYEPLSLIGETITLKYRSGVNSSTAGLTLTSTGTTLAGNLTVSGTGTSTFGGSVRLPWGTATLLSYFDATYSLGFAFDSTNRKLVLRAQSGDAPANGKGTIAFETGATPSEIARFAPSTGNFLLKSDGVDSGNGKLQLATHTTSAGGIGFGTDLSLYRANTGFLILNDASAALDCRIGLYNQGTQRGLFEAYNVNTAIWMGAASAGWSTIITSGNQATALTLDSSQNATFAGAVTAGSTITSSIAGAGAGFRIERTGGSASLGTILNTGGEIVHDYNSFGYSFRVSTVEKFNINATRALFTGKINAANLPTSASGLSAGDIWNDGGTLKIV